MVVRNFYFLGAFIFVAVMLVIIYGLVGVGLYTLITDPHSVGQWIGQILDGAKDAQ